MMLNFFKNRYHYFFSKKLNKGHWLTTQIHDLKRSNSDIAKEIGCSEKYVKMKVAKRIKKGEISKDVINGVHTCEFHLITKSKIVIIFKLFKNKITKPIDELYPQIKSRNAKIFAKILLEIDQKDKDTQGSTGIKVGLNINRKDLYLLAGKFIIVLYEFDSYYAERMDYLLKRILEHNGTFYFDELANPDNWYPNRSGMLAALYFTRRNLDDDIITMYATDLIKKGKMKIPQDN